MPIIIKPIHSWEKCFMDENIDSKSEFTSGSALGGETYYYEVAYTTTESEHDLKALCRLTLESPIAPLVTVYSIEQVPVRVPYYRREHDENYLRTTPGLYPDLLAPLSPDAPIFVPYGELKSLLVAVKIPENYPAGEYPITLGLTYYGDTVAQATTTIKILDANLPAQEIKVTEWFHGDCIADYYELDIYSEKHWEYIENYIRTAVEHGINTILTPVFTPPLDTAIGGERPTTQLVDVYKSGDSYTFGFEKLERWVRLCDKLGVELFEISHLYTQWGAAHAPKVMAYENGEYKKIFGWETDSLSDEYRVFLRAFLTAFIAEMKALGVDKRCIFHISDEPGLIHLDQYRRAKGQIFDILDGYMIVDALSDFDFYKTGAVANPIPANNHIDPFLEAGVENLWTYYCCAQCVDVSNRLIAMPMERTRVIGTQFWKYRIAGFLQWGYNFWYSQESLMKVNPFLITDGSYFTPAGDCFAVYPGAQGEPLISMHMIAFTQALYDLRAMRLAESLCGRDAVLSAMEDGLDYSITFSRYPHNYDYTERLREKINKMIDEKITE